MQDSPKTHTTSHTHTTGQLHRLGRRTVSALVLGALLTGLTASVSAQTVWYSGERLFGQVAVEPAVDLATGNEIFLLVPYRTSIPVEANQNAHAPMYIVLYPTASSINPKILNCQPINCDHGQTSPYYAVEGHDHLVGIPPTGDYNVAWDVIQIHFTPQGFADGAINNRILTQDELTAALDAGDVVAIGPVTSFNCAKTSITTYLHGTPMSFTP